MLRKWHIESPSSILVRFNGTGEEKREVLQGGSRCGNTGFAQLLETAENLAGGAAHAVCELLEGGGMMVGECAQEIELTANAPSEPGGVEAAVTISWSLQKRGAGERTGACEGGLLGA